MPTGGEMFLQLFDEKQAIETPHGMQLLDSKIQELRDDEEDMEEVSTYCTSHIASVGENFIAIMNMSVSDDGYEQEEDSELWKTVLEKIGWKLQAESDNFSMSASVTIYDFYQKIILILDVICPTDGVGFSKYSIDFQKPEDLWDLSKIPFGDSRHFEPDEDQRKFLIGVYKMMLRLIQPIGETEQCATASAPILID